MITLTAIIEAWNTFFHSPEPATTIAVFRILWGGLLVLNGLLLWRHAAFFFGPAGLLSVQCNQRHYGTGRFSLFRWLPMTNGSAYFVISLNLLASASLTIGCCTRVSALVVFITLVSLRHRNPLVFHSGDSVLRLLTFLMIFSRAGQAYSIDCYIDSGAFVGSRDTLGSPWCERLMQLQISIIYLRTVFWKLQGRLWIKGTAAYYPPQLRNFSRMRWPGFLRRSSVIRLATWGTLAVEGALGLLIWVREFRLPVLVSGACLHLGLELMLNLQLFGWTMLVGLFLFVPSAQVDRLLDWL